MMLESGPSASFGSSPRSAGSSESPVVEMNGTNDPSIGTSTAADGDVTTNGDGHSHRQSSLDVEQSLPTVAEVTGRGTIEHVDYMARRRRRSCLWGVSIVVIVVLLAVTIGLTVQLSKNNKSSLSSSSSDEENTEQTMIDSRERYDAMVRFLSENGISSITDLDNGASPQHQAVTFMALLDPLRLEIPHSHIIQEGYQFVTRYILSVLYFATEGEGWTQKRHFLSELPTCQWWHLNMDPRTQRQYKYTGVICNSNGVITNLILPNTNLHGKLPTEMGLLTTLKALVLSENELHGSIPTTFKQLYWLEHLWLSHNTLTGTLPPWIDSYIGLESLDLSYNRLVGELPIQLVTLQHMVLLALDNNMLTGPIHKIFNLKNASITKAFENLQFLYLESNRFKGPLGDHFMLQPGSSSTSPLVALDVSNNHLTGTLPVHLFTSFSNLQVLDLNSNQLTGEFPRNANPNTALTFLALQNNAMTGEVSGLLPDLEALTHLDVSSNSFTQWHIDLGAMTTLTYLFLANNPFPQGPFPSFLSSLTNLQELSLKATKRTGTLPNFVADMKKLVLLDLEDNQLTGRIPSELGGLSWLQYVLLNRNQLSNSVPAELSNLQSLRLLFLDSNKLTGDLGSVVCGNRQDPFVVADCGASSDGSAARVSCDCCDQCCSEDEPCNDDNFVPSNDPTWQFGYQRFEYSFGPTRHSISDAP